MENENYNCDCRPVYHEDYCSCACTPEICPEEGCGCGCVENDELSSCNSCCNTFNIFD